LIGATTKADEKMKAFGRIYDGLIYGLAGLGAFSLLVVMLVVVIDVVLRNTGFAPMQWASAVVEYILLFATCAAAPWLVRINGHVSINVFANAMPPWLHKLTGRFALVLAVIVQAILAWTAFHLGMEQYHGKIADIRSISIPGWILYSFLSVGFGLMAMEFLLMLLRGEVYTGEAGAH
jgi:C4-dicarboxylate transporter DctQ subunit